MRFTQLLTGRVLRRLIRAFRPNPPPVMVHQFAKVGSTSVQQELLRVYRGPVHHTHCFANFDVMEQQVRAAMADPSAALAEISNCRALRSEFEKWRGPRWKIITLVRDPVARSISLMFHCIDAHFPGFTAKTTKVAPQELARVYREHYANDPSNWFDMHIRDVFGIDVFGEPFPHDRGYHTYHGERADVLLIRLEDLNECWPTAAREFLGLKDTSIPHLNTNMNYIDSLKRALISESAMDELYHSRVSRHFYSARQIAQWQSSWRAAMAPQETRKAV